MSRWKKQNKRCEIEYTQYMYKIDLIWYIIYIKYRLEFRFRRE